MHFEQGVPLHIDCLYSSIPCFNTLRSRCPSRLRLEKVQVKSQWSCTRVQLTPLRVPSPSLLNDVNANQVGEKDYVQKCEMNIKTFNIRSFFFFLTCFSDDHLLYLCTRLNSGKSNSNKSLTETVNIKSNLGIKVLKLSFKMTGTWIVFWKCKSSIVYHAVYETVVGNVDFLVADVFMSCFIQK